MDGHAMTVQKSPAGTPPGVPLWGLAQAPALLQHEQQPHGRPTDLGPVYELAPRT